MKRRHFLRNSALLTASGLTTVGLHGWVARMPAQANASQKKLVVILLRGAVDGLNVVVPYQEAAYYESRPTIAIAPPGKQNGALDLDGFFGLHPALADLMPQWQAGHLAFVQASGSPDPSRSHFDAQFYMETGKPGDKSNSDGWLNRLLTILPTTTPTRAVNVGNTTPQILLGSAPVANYPVGQQTDQPMPIDRPRVQSAFDQLYANQGTLGQAYQEGRQARELLLAELSVEMQESAQGAPSPAVFANDIQRLAQLLKGDTQTQIAFMALGGWDTHVNQGGGEGQLASRLQPLGRGLASLAESLGPVFDDTVVVVMSEFGRTVTENGNRGTDHGHGNAMWLLGGGLQGGQVYGEWPGLESSQRYEERDLAITTDFRDVLASVLSSHLALSPEQLAQVFPGYSPSRRLVLV